MIEDIYTGSINTLPFLDEPALETLPVPLVAALHGGT